MNIFIKYGLRFTIFYFGINWLADNPQVVDSVRDMTNSLVSVATTAIGTAVAS
jgi:hypothetical protein